MSGNGRPSKYSKAIAQRICDLVREGHAVTSAAEAVGIPRSTVSDWRRQHSDFSDGIRGAELEFEEKLLNVVRTAAVGYTATKSKYTTSDKDGDKIEEWEEKVFNPQYATWLLARRYPENWSERTILQRMAEREARNAIAWVMQMVSEDARDAIATVISGTRYEPETEGQAASEVG